MLEWKKSVDYSVVDKKLKQAFSSIKDEFSEHLLAINENTNEVQANYEYLCDLDAKIDKLAERIEELALFARHPATEVSPGLEVAPLTRTEQEVFMALYSLVQEQDKVSYLDIGRRCGMTEPLVQSYITNLIGKGVPVQKRYHNNDVVLQLDKQFSEKQAKENILGISELISEKVILQ